jgi:predicted RNase H-like HicB family nuclease
MKYTIFLTQESQENFHAIVPNLPNCHAYAHTRNKALEAIREAITQVVNRSEMVQLDIPTQPKNGQFLDETPWQWFGAFSDDPTWGALFDDIEQKRNSITME